MCAEGGGPSKEARKLQLQLVWCETVACGGDSDCDDDVEAGVRERVLQGVGRGGELEEHSTDADPVLEKVQGGVDEGECATALVVGGEMTKMAEASGGGGAGLRGQGPKPRP